MLQPALDALGDENGSDSGCRADQELADVRLLKRVLQDANVIAFGSTSELV
jgi:hypothetical protein